MKPIKLQCLLMSNNEIMFMGRSLGFFKPEELERCSERIPLKDLKK